MMSRSMAMPIAPTTSGASSIPAHSGRCASRTAVSTVKAPAVKNSPWARLTIRIMPKIRARPSASRTRIVMELRISSATMPSVSRLMPAGQPWSGWSPSPRSTGPGGGAAARAGVQVLPLLRLVLRVLVRVLDEIAQLHRLGWRDVGEALEDVPAVVLVHGGQVHGEDDVVAGGVQLHMAHGGVPLDPALERLGDRLALEAPGLLDALGPEVPAVVAFGAGVADVVVRVVHLLLHGGLEHAVLRVVDLVEVRIAGDQPFHLLGVEHDVLVAEAEGGRDDRDLVLEARRRELPIEVDVSTADEERHEDVGLRLLDAIDGGVEIRHVERDELHLAHVLALLAARYRLQPPAVPPEDVPPLPRDVTEVVVGGDGICLRPVLLQGVLRERPHLLGRRLARDEDVLVAHAALVNDVVEVELLVLVDHGAEALARGRRDAAVDDGHLVLEDQLLGELREVRDVRLRIVLDQLELLAEEAALRVDLGDRVLRARDGGQPVDVDPTGLVEQASHRHLVALRPGGPEPDHRGNHGRAADYRRGPKKAASIELSGHRVLPPAMTTLVRHPVRGPRRTLSAGRRSFSSPGTGCQVRRRSRGGRSRGAVVDK